jgi:PAS domain S-box-containing protein
VLVTALRPVDPYAAARAAVAMSTSELAVGDGVAAEPGHEPALDGALVHGGGMFVLFDTEGRFRYVSPGAPSLVVDGGDLIGRFLCASDDDEPRFVQLDRLRQEVQRTGNVLRSRFADEGHAGRRDYDCVLAPFRYGGRAEGPVDGVVCTVHEERPRPPEISPDEAVERFEQAFVHAPVGMAIVDLDGRWLDVNGALCELLGHPAPVLTSMTVSEVTHPEDVYRDLVYVRQLTEGEITSYQLEKRWVRADGAVVWVQLAVSLTRDPDGEPHRLVLQAHDVTGRKLAEARARFLADIVECSADAVCARDGRGRVTYWNRAAQDLFGWEAGEVMGDVVTSDLPAERLLEAAQLRATAAGGQPVGPVDTVRRHRDGRDVDVSLTVAPIIDSGGELQGFASVARDITERRRNEAELRAAHVELQVRATALEKLNTELRRTNEDLQQFAYAASHDLSEPLRTITGFTQLLAQSYRGQLDDEADSFIEFITDGAVRMRQLLDGLLAYSRLNTRAAGPTDVDLGEIVEQVLASLQVRIADTGARVEVGPLPALSADRPQVVLALQHLVANALTFRTPGVAPAIAIRAEVTGDQLRLEVEDNGIGIEPRYRERVFAMFARLHTREAYEGTGIGLALVRRVAERHQGSVAIGDSDLGGTKVTMAFPLEPSTPAGDAEDGGDRWPALPAG